jgi:ferrochelatase
MIGILLVNMGGANSPNELKTFLSRMFKDPFILPFSSLGRNLLSFIISNTRYKKSWKKYELIGGSPIIEATEKTAMKLQKTLGDNFAVKIAFSYSEPFISESITDLKNHGVDDIIIIPLYPQASISTTNSVAEDVKIAFAGKKDVKFKFVKEFYNYELYLSFWANLILDHIEKNNYSNPLLLFSAHSIPMFLVKKGDTYPEAIESSARLIAEKTGFNYEVAYQSGMSGKWIGPDTKDRLKILSDSKIDNIIIIPISFVNENLETLYDIDHDIIPYGKNKLGIKNISRILIPVANNDFINLLTEIVKLNTSK